MIALFLVPLAFAGRVERVSELQTAGEHAEVVESVGKWEKGGALGDDAAALLALRDRSALTLALAERTVAALIAYRQNWPNSTLKDEALRAEWELAFAAAQDEGSSEAMRTYLATYPSSSFRAQANALEAGFAFQEATAIGTPAAIEAFNEAHPDSPYAATAWEALAVRTPGIHVRMGPGSPGGGLPQLLEGVPVTDGHILFPSRLVLTPARPTVAVNLPGTGRGATSEWWGLHAVAANGEVGVEPPVGRALAEALGVAAGPPGLLDLTPLPGVHSARVAAPEHPLVVPGTCEGFARFAYVLVSEGARTAFSFGVDCGAMVEESAASELLAALAAGESGDPIGAATRWEHALSLPDGPDLAAWMGTLAPDPRQAFLVRRPARADVLVWDGTATTWWHAGERGPIELARREGLWLADGPSLWAWAERPDTWTAPASGRCKAGTGERRAAVLVDTLGGARVDVPFTITPREGTLRATRLVDRVLDVEEAPVDACGKPGAPVSRPLPLPAGASAAAPPAWASALTASAAGHSVVSHAPRAMYTAFTTADPLAAPPPAPGGAAPAPLPRDDEPPARIAPTDPSPAPGVGSPLSGD